MKKRKKMFLFITFLLVVLLFFSCDDYLTEFKMNINSDSAYSGIADPADYDYVINNLTCEQPKCVVDYTWEFYAGLDVKSMRLFFKDINIIGSESSLILKDAEDNVLKEYKNVNYTNHWTSFYSTNKIKIQLKVNSHLSKKGEDNFTLNKAETLSSFDAFINNNPETQLVVDGKTPNMQVMQDSQSNHNKEVYGLIPAKTNHYYLSLTQGTSSYFDYVLLPQNDNDSLKTVYDLKQTGTVPYDFNLDGYDDIAVFTNTGDVMFALNNISANFIPYHVANRKFIINYKEIIGAGRINDDLYPDLISVYSDTIRYALNNKDGSYPLFEEAKSKTIQLSSGYKNLFYIINDFDNDGFTDIGIIYKFLDKTKKDVFTIYRNDHNENFVNYSSHEITTSHEDIQTYCAGDFDKNNLIDIILACKDVNETKYHFVLLMNNGTNSNQIEYSEINPNIILDEIERTGNTSNKLQILTADLQNNNRDDLVLYQRNSVEPSSIIQVTKVYNSGSGNYFHTLNQTYQKTNNDNYYGTLYSGRFLNKIKNSFFMSHIINPFKQLKFASRVNFWNYQTNLLKEKPLYKIGDINRDGLDDVVIFTADNKGSVEVLLNKNSSYERHTSQVLFDCLYQTTLYNEIPFLGDVNGDGYNDIIVYKFFSYYDCGIYVSLNQQNLTFGPLTLWSKALVTGGILTQEAIPIVGDFNGDNKCDAGIAFIKKNQELQFQISLSTGSQFGANNQINDWLVLTEEIINDTTFNVKYVGTANMNNDSYKDIYIITNSPAGSNFYSIYSYLSSGTQSFEKRFELQTDYELEKNKFVFGNFAEGKKEDLSIMLPFTKYYDDPDHYLFNNYLAEEVNSWTVPLKGCMNDYYLFDCPLYKVQNDGGLTEEVLLFRTATDIEKDVLINLDIFQRNTADFDLYQGYLNIFQGNYLNLIGNQWIPHATLYSNVEIIKEVSNGYVFPVIVKVFNNGNSPGCYKLIANTIFTKADLDVFYLEKEPIPQDYYDYFQQFFWDVRPVFNDAFDGVIKMRNIDWYHLKQDADNDYRSELPFWMENDGYICLVNSPGRAHATTYSYGGGSIYLYYDNVNVTDSDTPPIFVHEYGHFAFDIRDEYCESPNNSRVNECSGCGFPKGYSGSVSLCPNSKMANSYQKEFCTELYHTSFGITNQHHSCWEDIGDCIITGVRCKKTPNPYTYTEPYSVQYYLFYNY